MLRDVTGERAVCNRSGSQTERVAGRTGVGTAGRSLPEPDPIEDDAEPLIQGMIPVERLQYRRFPGPESLQFPDDPLIPAEPQPFPEYAYGSISATGQQQHPSQVKIVKNVATARCPIASRQRSIALSNSPLTAARQKPREEQTTGLFADLDGPLEADKRQVGVAILQGRQPFGNQVFSFGIVHVAPPPQMGKAYHTGRIRCNNRLSHPHRQEDILRS